MGIETILFIFALVVIAAVWGMGRRSRRNDRSGHDTSPPRLSGR